MDSYKFEWDEAKNLSNINKHKLDFDFASKIFTDNHRIEWEDESLDYGEIRFITIGKVFSSVLTVVYTLRGDSFRIISACPSKKYEREIYNLPNF